MDGLHQNASDGANPAWSDMGLSEDTKRRLLLSSNSVTARFEAHKLWEQGYNGAKVKVGVFDTGIRADHPHVKNIRSASATAISSPVVPACLPFDCLPCVVGLTCRLLTC